MSFKFRKVQRNASCSEVLTRGMFVCSECDEGMPRDNRVCGNCGGKSFVFFDDILEIEVEVEASVEGGAPPSGMYGPPENYEPGDGGNVEDLIAYSDSEKEAFVLTPKEDDFFAEKLITRFETRGHGY